MDYGSFFGMYNVDTIWGPQAEVSSQQLPGGSINDQRFWDPPKIHNVSYRVST